MNNAQNEAVTVTHTDNDQAQLLRGLDELSEAVADLEKAGMMDKAKKAEAVIKKARDAIAGNVFATHKLFNEVTRLKGDVQSLSDALASLKKNGFGGN